jgi:hypothetical protein
MNRRFVVFLIVFSFAMLSFTQGVAAQTYQLVIVTAYGRDVTDDTAHGILSFTVVESSGESSQVAIDIDKDGIHDILEEFSPGDKVTITYDPSYQVVNKFIISDPENPPNQRIIWEGEADSVTKNSIEIPEIPMFLILPMFFLATLLAIMISNQIRRSSLKRV